MLKEQYRDSLESNVRDAGLYIHIPFCIQKCLYCDFASSPAGKDEMAVYVAAVGKELQTYRQTYPEFRPTTVFFGGGTPSLLPLGLLEDMLSHIRSFNLPMNAEISLESNPGTITKETLTAYRHMGINRISMGVQAVQDRLLEMMGRIHKHRDTYAGLEAIRAAGFDNINIDLMFGLPTQTLVEWEQSLDFAVQMDIPHLSCYSLKVEDHTPWGELQKKGELTPADDALDRHMYHLAVEKLLRHGIHRYEISNFAKDGYSCRHNLVYWRRGDYLGAGLAAHSFVRNKRFGNTEKFASYVTGVINGNKELTEEADISIDEALYETIILGLRLEEGIHLSKLEAEFGSERMRLQPVIDRLQKQLLLSQDGDTLRLTEKGFDLANVVFSAFG